MNNYPRETTEYITANVYLDGQLITTNVQLSVVPAGQRPTTWTPAEIIQGKTVYLINGLTTGSYTVWSKVTPVGSEEKPVTNHGSFRID